MSIRLEAEEILRGTFDRNAENRNFVPISFSHKILWELATRKYPNDANKQQVAMARYSPLVEWLATPRTIADFEKLKSFFFTRAVDLVEWKLIYAGAPSWHPYDGNPDREKWEDAVTWLFELGAELKIMPQRNLDDLPELSKEKMGHGLWLALEEGPQVCRYVKVHRDLELMARGLDEHRNSELMAIPIRRLGMIVGDFRVGDHSAHGQLIRNAKTALGRWGELLVVTPSRETILATTNKADAWPDAERVYRLSANKYIDYIWVADMPSKYWQDPATYWRTVWAKIKPDFVFLGEENHPLQEVYELQCKYLGGILLIDDQPVTRRSGDLMDI